MFLRVGKWTEALVGETACPDCGLRMDAILPSPALATAREQLRLALEQQRRRLAQAGVARAAANDGRPVIERFLRAVQAADLAPLVEILDETTLALIEELLSAAWGKGLHASATIAPWHASRAT